MCAELFNITVESHVSPGYCWACPPRDSYQCIAIIDIASPSMAIMYSLEVLVLFGSPFSEGFRS